MKRLNVYLLCICVGISVTGLRAEAKIYTNIDPNNLQCSVTSSENINGLDICSIMLTSNGKILAKVQKIPLRGGVKWKNDCSQKLKIARNSNATFTVDTGELESRSLPMLKVVITQAQGDLRSALSRAAGRVALLNSKSDPTIGMSSERDSRTPSPAHLRPGSLEFDVFSSRASWGE